MIKENTFSYWMRDNLKDAYSGLISQDIDFVFINAEKKKIFFIEEKNSLFAKVGPAQKVIFKMFDDFLGFQDLEFKFLGTFIIYLTRKIEFQKFIELIKNKLKNRQYYDIEEKILEKLWDCKGQPLIKKTERERSGYRGSIIKDILKDQLCTSNEPKKKFVENINWIFLNYCTGYFCFIEERINNDNNLDNNRREFIKIIDNLFKSANDKNIIEKKAKNPKSGALYKYLGYYKLVFSKFNPDDSIIYLNDVKIDKKDLINYLNLDNNNIQTMRDVW